MRLACTAVRPRWVPLRLVRGRRGGRHSARGPPLSDVPDVLADGSAASDLVMWPSARLVGGVSDCKAVLSPAGDADLAATPAGPASGGEPTTPVPRGSRRLGTFL